MEVRTCAILYNASFDLLNINLQNNYKFEKRYLGDTQLIDVFDETMKPCQNLNITKYHKTLVISKIYCYNVFTY